MKNQEIEELCFVAVHKAYEKGMIKAWQHIICLCRSCIKAHREELKKERIKQIVDMNKYRLKKGK